MSRYDGFDEKTRRSEWRADRIDHYASYHVKMNVYAHVFEKRLNEGLNPEELLRDLLNKMKSAEHTLSHDLFQIDDEYFSFYR